ATRERHDDGQRTSWQSGGPPTNVPCPTRATPARAASRSDARDGPDRKTTRKRRLHHRVADPCGTSTTGGGTSHGRKHHHEHASVFDARLERLLRKSQSHRIVAWQGSSRGLFADGVCLARSLSPRYRTNQQTNPRYGTRHRPSSARLRRRGKRRRSRGTCRLLSHRHRTKQP